MTLKHIAVFTIPQPVHVNPTLSIVDVLVRRGERITYVTSHLYAEQMERRGVKALRCPRFEFPHNQDNGDYTAPLEHQYSGGLTDLASRTLALTGSFFEDDRPDLIIFDSHSFAGAILAERLRVPAVRITSHLRIDEEITFNTESTDAFFRKHGINRKYAALSIDTLTIYLFAEEMQLGNHGGKRHIYAARCAPERPYQAMLGREIHDGRRNKVLVSCSTCYVQGAEYFQMCANAASQLSMSSFLAIAAQTDAASLELLPLGCELAISVPLPELMPKSRAIIFQGGMASTMEAIYHGLPMIMMTNGHRQLEMYAENVESHGLGVHLKKAEVSLEKIKSAIWHVTTDSEITIKIGRMQNLVRRSGGAEEVVNSIEEHMHELREDT